MKQHIYRLSTVEMTDGDVEIDELARLEMI